MPGCSGESGNPLLLKAGRSRLLERWWLLLHVILALATLASSAAPALRVALLLGLAVHFRWRRPTTCGLVLLGPDGEFALPAEGRFRLRLAPQTCYSGHWAELVFLQAPCRILLLRDQFTDSDWRRLIIALRESV